MFPLCFVGQLVKWGLWENEWTTRFGNGASFSIGDPLGDYGGGLLYRGLWEDSNSLFYRETLFIGDPARCQRRLCKRTSLSIGAPLGNLERDSFYRGLWETDEGAFRKRSVFLNGSSARGTCKEGREGYVKESYENGHLSPQRPRGTWRAVRLPRTSRDSAM